MTGLPGRVPVEVTVTSEPGTTAARLLRLAGQLPAHDPARHEFEAQLYMMLARSAWREADRLRELERRRDRRRPGRAP